MAKRRKKKRSTGQRDLQLNTYVEDVLSDIHKRRRHFVDDRRSWRPPISRGPLYDDGRSVDYGISDSPVDSRDGTLGRVRFVNPTRVRVCQKRKARRQALFRKGKVGKGKKVSKNRKMTEFSNIKC